VTKGGIASAKDLLRGFQMPTEQIPRCTRDEESISVPLPRYGTESGLLVESTGIGSGPAGSGGGVQSTQTSLTPSTDAERIPRSWLPSGPEELPVVKRS
jgi:hypothetical protein